MSKVSRLIARPGWSILVLSRFITLLAQLACPIVPISLRTRLERRLLNIIRISTEISKRVKAVFFLNI